MTGNMPQMSSYSFEQNPPIFISSQYPPGSVNLFQPDIQQSNQIWTDSNNGMPYFPPQGFPIPGIPIIPMGTPTHEQQQQQQIPNTSTEANQSVRTSSLSGDAQPFEPKQTTNKQPVDKQTLQFIPNQVLRNIPKK